MTAATDEDWYIPYNGPIEPPPATRPRNRPRGNTFGGPGSDSAPKVFPSAAAAQGTDDYYEDRDFEDEEDNTFGFPYSNPQMKSSTPVLTTMNPNGRPRAGSHASSIVSASSFYTNTQLQNHTQTTYNTTRTYFGGSTSSGGIGQAPEHSSHREKDKEHREKDHQQPRSPGLAIGPRFSIYSNMIRSSDRDKAANGGSTDKTSILSADWDTRHEDREPSHQRASVVSFLTFGKRGTAIGRASPISSQLNSPRGRTSSPVSLLSGAAVGRQSHESTRSRVAMLPIGEKTGAGVGRKGLTSLTPLTTSAHPGASGTATFVLTPTSPLGTASSTSSMAHGFVFPSHSHSQTPAQASGAKLLPIQRVRPTRSRSNTIESIGNASGNANGIRGNAREVEERRRGRMLDGSYGAEVNDGQKDGGIETPQYQGEHDRDGLMDVKMDSKWYEEAGYGAEDGRMRKGFGATQDRPKEYSPQVSQRHLLLF